MSSDAQSRLRTRPPKLHGRAFYESLGSPKLILAPMVAQSEYAWRRLTRSFMTSKNDQGLIAYSPMLHARIFADNPKYRESHFQPRLDGNKNLDRPLFVQFCANEPQALLDAARLVQPYCDAVDLNLGCPQGIAKRGHYGAFLQEDQPLIYRLVNKLHLELDIPVTAKMRILDTRQATLDYAEMLLSAGASIITVHGRTRDQKGHKTGLADWSVLRHLRDSLPPETVIFANGNILQHADLQTCLDETGVDGVMSAEGNLCDPAIFAIPPPIGQEGREYWRSKDRSRGGYRMDGVLRRYLDIIHTEVLQDSAPERRPLFLPGDEIESDDQQPPPPPTKKPKHSHHDQQSKKSDRCTCPNLCAMQAHLFSLLRPLVSKHTHIRDALAKCRAGDIPAYEAVLKQVEAVVRDALLEEERQELDEPDTVKDKERVEADDTESSARARERTRRPWFVCQPYVRPLPHEALAKGAIQLTKKELVKNEQEKEREASRVGAEIKAAQREA